ncbi:unnamed protein product [Penicillium palitans]
MPLELNSLIGYCLTTTSKPGRVRGGSTVRDMFREFDDDITTECDDIDGISQSAWLWRKFDGELQGPERRQIIRMYIDAPDARREYEARMALAEARVRSRRDGALKHVLRRLLDRVRLPAVDEVRGMMLPPQTKFEISPIKVLYEYDPTAPGQSSLSESTDTTDQFTLEPTAHS